MRRPELPVGLAAIWLSPFSLDGSARAYTPPPLTLAQAQARAAARSPALAAAQRQVEAAEGALRQARARPNPQLNALMEDTRSAGRQTTATLDFPLELGGKRAARLADAAPARELALAELAQSPPCCRPT